MNDERVLQRARELGAALVKRDEALDGVGPSARELEDVRLARARLEAEARMLYLGGCRAT